MVFIVMPKDCFFSLAGSLIRCSPFFCRPRFFTGDDFFVGFLRGFSRAFIAVESLDM